MNQPEYLRLTETTTAEPPLATVIPISTPLMEGGFGGKAVLTDSFPPDSKSKTEKTEDQELSSTERRKNEVWDACVETLGYKPLTESEHKLWGKMVSSLRRAEADREKIISVGEWYRRHWPNIDLTITALEKWYSHFLSKAEKRVAAKSVQASFCDYCGKRDGSHSPDCSRHLYESS